MKVYNFLFISCLLVALYFMIPSMCSNRLYDDVIKEVQRDTIIHTDTFVRHDTIIVPYPRLVSVMVRDTVFIHDMAGNKDTLYNENKIYQDSNYTAWVSGINASLDSIETYATHSFTTKTVTERISVPSDGLFSGVGIINAGERFSPSVGLIYESGALMYSADIGAMDGKPLFMLGVKYKIK